MLALDPLGLLYLQKYSDAWDAYSIDTWDEDQFHKTVSFPRQELARYYGSNNRDEYDRGVKIRTHNNYLYTLVFQYTHQFTDHLDFLISCPDRSIMTVFNLPYVSDETINKRAGLHTIWKAYKRYIKTKPLPTTNYQFLKRESIYIQQLFDSNQ